MPCNFPTVSSSQYKHTHTECLGDNSFQPKPLFQTNFSKQCIIYILSGGWNSTALSIKRTGRLIVLNKRFKGSIDRTSSLQYSRVERIALEIFSHWEKKKTTHKRFCLLTSQTYCNTVVTPNKSIYMLILIVPAVKTLLRLMVLVLTRRNNHAQTKIGIQSAIRIQRGQINFHLCLGINSDYPGDNTPT